MKYAYVYDAWCIFDPWSWYMHIFVFLILDSCIKFHALKIWQRQNSLLDLIWCILSAASFLMHHLWCLSSGVSPRAHPLQLIVDVFSTVGFRMYPHIGWPGRCNVTLVAFIWLFSTVRYQMYPRIACLCGCKVILVAFICLFFTVRFQMYPAWEEAQLV